MCSSHTSHAISTDVSMGVVGKSMIAAAHEQESSALHAFYAAPSLDLGVTSQLAGPLSFGLHLKADTAALEQINVYNVMIIPSYTLELSAGVAYQVGDSSFYFGPAISRTSVSFAEDSASEDKVFSGFGAVASLSQQVSELVGVRVQAQHIINRSVSTWETEQLGGKIGPLKTNVSQLGVSMYTNFTYES